MPDKHAIMRDEHAISYSNYVTTSHNHVISPGDLSSCETDTPYPNRITYLP